MGHVKRIGHDLFTGNYVLVRDLPS